MNTIFLNLVLFWLTWPTLESIIKIWNLITARQSLLALFPNFVNLQNRCISAGGEDVLGELTEGCVFMPTMVLSPLTA